MADRMGLDSLRHSHDNIYQALYRFSVLQATESWAGPGNEANAIVGIKASHLLKTKKIIVLP